MGAPLTRFDVRSAVFIWLLCQRFPAYVPKAAFLSKEGLEQYFAIRGKVAIVLKKGILLLDDYRKEVTGQIKSVHATDLQQLVSGLPNLSDLEAEFRALIDTERARYNTEEKHEQEALHRYKRGRFKLRRYASWDYPFVVGLPKRFNGGKRGRRFFLDVDAAVEFIGQQLELSRTITAKVLSIPEEDRLMLVRAKDKLAKFGKTVDEAVEFYVNHLMQQERSISLRDLTREWYALHKNGLPEVKIKDLRVRMWSFRKEIGNIKANQVTGRIVDDYLRGIKHEASRRMARETLSTLFAFAVARGYMEINHALEPVTEKLIRKDPGILHVPEFKTTLTVVDDDLDPCLWIGGWAGPRDSELERLTWPHIDWNRRLIEVEVIAGKGGFRTVDILPPLWGRLQKYRGRTGRVCKGDLASQMEKLRVKLGWAKWTPDTLRRSFACHHLAHFQDPKGLLQMLGEADIGTVYRNFRHIVTPEEGKAWFDL